MNFRLIAQFSVLAFVATATCLFHADAAPDTEAYMATDKSVTQWKWGEPTNDVVVGVFVKTELNNSKEFRIRVFLHEAFDTNDPPPTFTSEPVRSQFRRIRFFGEATDNPTNFTGWPGQLGVFFKATNSLSALLELRDQQGKVVPLLKPVTGYPSCFRLRELGTDGPFKAHLADPLIGRLPELARFELSDWFAINKGGEYQLTVWPKVYKRVKENDDLCQRVDLPPVTVNIKWDAKLEK